MAEQEFPERNDGYYDTVRDLYYSGPVNPAQRMVRQFVWGEAVANPDALRDGQWTIPYGELLLKYRDRHLPRVVAIQQHGRDIWAFNMFNRTAHGVDLPLEEEELWFWWQELNRQKQWVPLWAEEERARGLHRKVMNRELHGGRLK